MINNNIMTTNIQSPTNTKITANDKNHSPLLNLPESELSKLMTTSTLVETVSINYEDFTEGFLTCGTCLYTYDADEHSPKLLPCSHTICRVCLEKISSNATIRDPSGNFRCPICRELIQPPRGGVMAFPPSFLVNQLLDLVASQRREVIPKCSSHVTQELLYCEPCDLVFCNLCTGEKHDNQNNTANNNNNSNALANREHTVIPFSIAIKRMSEILLYKAQQCITKLDESSRNVLNEMQKLDQNSELSFEDINRTFQEVINIVDKRRQELLNCAKKIREDKRAVLREQLNNIELEKSKLEKECNEFKYQVEVRDISKKINDLKGKLSSVNTMLDPRENCFLRFEYLRNSTIENIQELVNSFGSIRTSNTFPSLCVATVGKCSVHLRSFANVITFDYNGQRQKFGGDPLSVTLVNNESQQNIPCKLNDNRDGTYEIQFVPSKHGDYLMKIAIFGRPIKTYPLEFTVSEHINPLCIYGCKGSDLHQFSQPTSLAIDNETGFVYVLDTGNGRIKKLLQNQCNNSPFRLICHIESKEFENRAATGIAFCQCTRSLLVTNWRNRNIVKFDCDGRFLGEFTHPDLLEPTCISVNGNSGQILVVDNSSHSMFLFQPSGKLIKMITTYINGKTKKLETLGEISGTCFHPETNEIIVVGEKVMLYSPNGEFIQEFCPNQNNKIKGRYCGVAVDKANNILAARADKSRNVIQVIDFSSGLMKFSIDSNDAKLKRPSCLALTNDDHVIVVDLGNDCIKKYRYY